jgi:DNA-binding MarR family transcriptional regulator
LQLPDPSLGLLVVSARHAIRNAIATRARRYRLTTQQFWGMVTLHRSPGVTPGELGGWMLLDPPAASRLVAHLLSRKLIEARPDRADRRRTLLFLTEKGEQLGATLEAVAQEYWDATVEGMTPDQVEALRGGLRQLVENLARFTGEPESPPPRSERLARSG